MKVVANAPYIYAWAAKEFKQKAAKIPGGRILTVLKEESGWYEVEKLPEGTYGAYPQVANKWFVDPVSVTQYVAPITPPVIPPVGSASDIEAATHIVALIRWLKEL